MLDHCIEISRACGESADIVSTKAASPGFAWAAYI